MPIVVTCPECGGKLRVGDHLVGKRIKCPKCSGLLMVAAEEDDAIMTEKPSGASEGITASLAPDEESGDEERAQRRRKVRKIRRDDTDDAVSTIIPYKNGRALVAYYLGVFSLIPCAALLLGPAALVLGILGLRYVRENPTAKGTGHAIAGIVLGSLTTLGNLGVIGAFVLGIILNKR
jgi:Zn-finger nucleic acid-binding protein